VIQFSPLNTQTQSIVLEVHHPICDTIDRITIAGRGIETILTSNTLQISKPNQPIGITTTESIIITNSGSASAFISAGTFGLQAPFQISNSVPALPVLLQPGESVTLTLSISMNSSGTAEDTITIASLANQNSCSDTISIPVNATASLPSLGLRFGNTPKADPKSELYDIPILYSIPFATTVIADMTISFSVNGKVFYPKSTNNGTLSSTLDANGNRIVNVRFNAIPLSGNDSILTTIKGIIQLDTITQAPLTWNPVQWNTAPYASINAIDGSIELEICEVGGERLIINGLPPQFLLMYPNPVESGNGVQVQFPINRLGNYDIVLSDMQGRSLQEKSITFNDIQSLGSIYLLQLQMSNLASGTYFVSLCHEGMQITEQLIIVP
jgi:hypothetical protein